MPLLRHPLPSSTRLPWPSARRRPVLRSLVAVVAALALTAAAAAPADAAPKRRVAPKVATTAPWVGLLGPTTTQGSAMAGGAVNRVMVSAGWDSIQPRPDVWNTTALTSIRTRVNDLYKQGYDVVLDLGLQYPPAWVFALPGQTRFVNQYGETWQGTGLSTAVPNAVFNPNVRAAEGRYLARVGQFLANVPLAAVRVGGMLTAELRYPPAATNGHLDAMWFYDPVAQRSAPVKGWKPGTGTPAQAAASISYYFGALTGYLVWQMQTVAAAFPGRNQQVLFPSWGLRPGMVDNAVATVMGPSTPKDVLWSIGSGLDWDSQVRAMAGTGIASTVYCTWLDAPSYGNSTAGMSPVRYLKQLADRSGLPTAGENTGRGGLPALRATLDAVSDLGLTGTMYMSGRMLDDGSAGLTVTDLVTAVGDWRTAHDAWS